MTATEYRQALDTLPFGKRLPGAVYLLGPVDDPRMPPLLRLTVAELRKRLKIGMEFNPVAEAGLPEDTQRGWRRVLFHALSDGEARPPGRKRRRPAESDLS